MELDKLEVTNYDKVVGYAAGRPMVNWVTESVYYSRESLSKEKFTDIVKADHHIAGEITYKKFKQTYSSGKILYKHVLYEEMY